MNGPNEPDDDGEGGRDAAAIRPFLASYGRPPVTGAPRPSSPPPLGGDTAGGSGAPSGGIRPYFLTRGRVASADGRVRVETVVVARPNAAFRLGGQAWEQRRLLALAERPISVVELAVAMAVPVGVVLVLVGDLSGDGLLDISIPAVAPGDDVALIRRLIDRVGAL